MINHFSSLNVKIMFLKLAHTNLEVYKFSYELTLETYRVTRHFPDSERYNLISQIRRAAISVHMNIAEGSSRKSEVERKRYYEIARGSVIEIDTALDIAFGLEYILEDQVQKLGETIIKSFKLLTGLINK
jgi:four helix bundle protein